MSALRIHDLLANRVLVTRESARSIAPEIGSAIASGEKSITLDFAGIDAITPSFMDEVLSVVEEFLTEGGAERLEIIIVQPPTRLSSKFAAIGRGHGLAMEERPDGSWLISRDAEQERHT
jgi:hypothetical protein